MNIDFQKVADSIEKSSKEIQNIMFSADLLEQIGKIAGDNDLDEETFLKLADEIGYIILDLKPKSSLSDSLLNIGIEKDKVDSITKELEEILFKKLELLRQPQKLVGVQKTNGIQSSPKQNSSVGQSFENAMENQMKAMMPARLASEVVAGGPARPANSDFPGKPNQPANSNVAGGPASKEGEVPQNLPTDESSRTIHNYIGTDPYREPLE